MTGLLLKGGTVFDGLGTPGRMADVAVAEGRVAAVGGDPPPGLRTIDCTGLYVTPGFVDSHAHSDLIHLLEAPQPFKLLQGVTTEVVEDGRFTGVRAGRVLRRGGSSRPGGG